MTIVLTKKQIAESVTRDNAAKATYSNYECPFCRKFVWWDEPHDHSVKTPGRRKK